MGYFLHVLFVETMKNGKSFLGRKRTLFRPYPEHILSDIYNSSDKYIARLKVPSYCIEKECYKEAKKWGKALKRQKVKNSYYVKYKTRYETNISLYEKLQWIRTNCNKAYSSEYYVNYLQQIKELMIECGYNSI